MKNANQEVHAFKAAAVPRYEGYSNSATYCAALYIGQEAKICLSSLMLPVKLILSSTRAISLQFCSSAMMTIALESWAVAYSSLIGFKGKSTELRLQQTCLKLYPTSGQSPTLPSLFRRR